MGVHDYGFLSGTKLDHIGIAVRDIEAAREIYSLLGLESSEVEAVPDQGVKIQMIKTGDSRIELLQPVDQESPIEAFLNKRGEGIHHIAFLVEDIHKAMKICKSNGILPIGEPTAGAAGKQILFLHPKDTGSVLIELVQE